MNIPIRRHTTGINIPIRLPTTNSNKIEHNRVEYSDKIAHTGVECSDNMAHTGVEYYSKPDNNRLNNPISTAVFNNYNYQKFEYLVSQQRT